MKTCTSCREAYGYSDGIKGNNYDLKRIMLVMNRPDRRILTKTFFNDHDIALARSQTGKILVEILREAELGFEDVYITNTFKCLLPGDREPTRKEYENCAKVLEEQMHEFGPRKIIAFGYRTYESMFQEMASQFDFDIMTGATSKYKGIDTLISHHPGMIWKYPHEKRKEIYEAIKEFIKK
jgi:uracil-DNA glycosylase family 4